MDDVIILVCGLAIALLFVMAIGHGLWLLAASIGRAVFGSAPPAGRPCPICGDQQGIGLHHCRTCGAPADTSEQQRARAELLATRRRIRRWRESGQLSAEQFTLLTQMLAADERALGDQPQLAPVATGPRTADTPFAASASFPAPASAPAPGTASPHAPGSLGAWLAPRPAETSAEEEPLIVAEIVDVAHLSPLPRSPAAPSSGVVGHRPHPLDDLPAEARGASPAAPAAPPRRPLADMLQALMEEKNIRWGEIIGGLLIVVSAVGLVVSLRATLKDRIPYFPALSFMLVTAAIHAAGIYSLRRWNLRQTSRGVLVIATLLVPLSFLVAIVLTGSGEQQRPVTDPLFLLALAVGTVSFTAMNYFAARALLHHGWQRLMIAVLGTSFSQLAINRLYDGVSSPLAAALHLAIPVGCFGIPMVRAVLVRLRRPALGKRPLAQFLLELGLGAFAVAAPIALYVTKSDGVERALSDLSPMLSLVGGIVLVAGLLLHLRVTHESLAAYRVAGTTLVILGAGTLVAMVGFAWPQLELLIAVGLLNFALLTYLAWQTGMPLLHPPAIASLAVVCLAAFQLVRGFDLVADARGWRLVQALFSGSSAVVLSCYATLVAAAATIWSRLSRPEDRLYYLGSSGGLAVVCVVVATYAGFLAPASAQGALATPVLLYFAAVALAVSWRVPRTEVTVFGSLLALAGFVHALRFNNWILSSFDRLGGHFERPFVVALLAHALLAALAGVALARWLFRSRPAGTRPDASPDLALARLRSLALPLGWSSLATSLLVVALVVVAVRGRYASHALYLAVAAIPWLAFTRLRHPAACFAVFQGIAMAALSLLATAICARSATWTGQLLTATHLSAQILALSASCAAWSLIRAATPARGWPARCWPAGPSVDQVLLAGLAFGTLGLGWLCCLPHVGEELGTAAVASSAAVRLSLPAWSGVLAWLAIGMHLAAWLACLGQCRSRAAMAGVVVASAAVPLLASSPAAASVAVASALRWLYAGLLAVWCAAAWWSRRHAARNETPQEPAVGLLNHPLAWRSLFAPCRPRRAAGGQPSAMRPHPSGPPLRQFLLDLPPLVDWMRAASLLVGALAVLGLTTAAVASVATGHIPGGPLPGSLFDRLGPAVSYAVPLMGLVAVLFAYAVLDSRSDFALLASGVFQYAASLACLLPRLTRGAPFDAEAAASLVQWNLAALSVFTAVWIGARPWIDRDAGNSPTAWRLGWNRYSRHLSVQLGLLAAVQLLVVGWVAVVLFFAPHRTSPSLAVLGGWPSYLALAVAAGAIVWLTRSLPQAGERLHLLALGGLTLVHVVAASMHSADQLGRWWGHHTLAGARFLFALGLVSWVAAVRWRNQTRPASESAREPAGAIVWTMAATGLLALAALRAAGADPWRPAWTTGLMAGAAVLVGGLAVIQRRQWFAYGSSVLTVLSATLWLVGLAAGHSLRSDPGLVSLHAAALGLAGIVWLSWELYFQRRGAPGLDARTAPLPAHRVAAFSLIVGSILFAGMAAGLFCFGFHVARLDVLQRVAAGVAWLAMLTLFAGTLWDRRATLGPLGLYVWLTGVALFAIDQFAWSAGTRRVAMVVWFATQVAVSGWIWSWGAQLARVGVRLGINEPVEGLRRVARWLPVVTQALVAGVSLVGFAMVLTSADRAHRVAAACTPLLLAGGTAGLAQQLRRDWMQLLTLMLLTLGGALLGWSDLEPSTNDAVLLARAFRLLIAVSAGAFLLGVVAVRVTTDESGWRPAARRAAVVNGALAGAVLLVVLVMEAATFQPGTGAPVSTPQLLVVSVVLVGLVAALISLAVLPGRDPLALSERGRMAYVYAAQVLSGLLFAHLYLAQPSLFGGTLRPYWPYIVMAVAFAGVGVGELFERLGWRVLAEPFQRSGAFLPLVPALGMWLIGSNSNYAMVLFGVGVLYLLVSFSRRSSWASVAATVAGNGAFWSLLDGTEDLTFSRHPQFWLIPPAASVLVAAQLNRQRLTEAQLAGVRYVAVSVIYLSSAVEMLRIGIGQSLWPPVIMIALAIAGVFVGIVLRVRAYLYLGTVFVGIGTISMVAHAARSIQHVWPWWAFCIVSGLLILALFGWFEGRRVQLLGLVERLRQWEK